MDIELYLTAKKDALPKLNSLRSFDQVKVWFKDVGKKAIKKTSLNIIDNKILEEIKPHPVVSIYAIVFHGPETTFMDAYAVGKPLKDLFGKLPCSYGVMSNKSIKGKDFRLLVEVVVNAPDKKDEEETVGQN